LKFIEGKALQDEMHKTAALQTRKQSWRQAVWVLGEILNAADRIPTALDALVQLEFITN
jgi:hypothetical protein